MAAIYKRAILLLLITLLPLTATGCWNRREVNDMVVNTALGFDRVELNGKPAFRISMLVTRPAGGGGGAATMQRPSSPSGDLVTTTGDTIFNAVRDWTTRSSRQFFAGHVLVMVVGEELARDGIAQFMDIALRHGDIRLRTWVVVCEGRALNALQAQPEFETLISSEIRNIIEKSSPSGSKVPRSDLRQVAHDLLTPGKDVVVPRLRTIVPPEAVSSAGQVGLTTSPGGTGRQSQTRIVEMAGAAAFSGDRLVGWLNEDETMGMLFIKNQANEGVITVAFDSPEKNTSFVFRKVRAKVEPLVTDDGIVMKVRISGTGDLREQSSALIRVNEQDLHKLENLVNREVERLCRRAVARSQELNSDVFGFGNRLHLSQPEVWKELQGNWRQIFPALKVDVKADFTVEHVGLSSQPIVVR
ncbi:MAG: Ger(x)C family spore germination protein [Syntrophomonadaceae bacterium]|nr:Ger(x)C family spore germination protein [Syntrophomonadaceae bacterium]